jgi:LPS export ABC transporter protein LptC
MTGRRLRTILLVGISAILGIVVYKVAENIWQQNKKVIRKEVVRRATNALPDALTIKDFHRAQVDGDRKVWEVFGDEARYNKDEKRLAVQKARIYFYQKDNSAIEALGTEGNLWMGEGQSDLEKAQLKGNVQVTFRGYVLTTNEILYFKSRNMMVLPGRVSIKGEGMELDGGQMEISLNDEVLKLNRDVKTKVVPGKLPTKGSSNEKKAG